MPDIAVAASSNTPKARKGPLTSSPSSKGSAKSQQQRKTSVSQATTNVQRQRRTSTSQAIPKTQQQRKDSTFQSSPKFFIQQRYQSSAAEVPTLAGNKRKIKAEENSPTKMEFQMKFKGADTGAAQPNAQFESPPKKQTVEEMKNESTQEHTASSPVKLPPATPNPQQPSVLPSSTSSQTTQMSNSLLRHVLQTNPSLIPTDIFCPITSSHIDATAHMMWQVAFKHGGLLQRACMYSAMFSPLKLAALAKLNILPSWWYFRDLVVKELPGLIKCGGGKGVNEVVGGLIDDREMQDAWKEAVKWCAGVVGDRVAVLGVGEGMRRVVKDGKAEREETGKMNESKMEEGGEGGKMRSETDVTPLCDGPNLF